MLFVLWCLTENGSGRKLNNVYIENVRMNRSVEATNVCHVAVNFSCEF